MSQSAHAGCAGIIIGLILLIWALEIGGLGGLLLGLVGSGMILDNLNYSD